MSSPLVLSLFPGIGLLDAAFEEAGFCVVRGPDLLWGGDISRFHPPAGKFDGVIGGPPCPNDSDLGAFARTIGQRVQADRTGDFRRVVEETRARWFLREGLVGARAVDVDGYVELDYRLNNRWVGGVQHRVRKFTFGVRGAIPRPLHFASELVCLEHFDRIRCVTANATVWDRQKQRPYGDKSERYLKTVMLPAQGLPPGFLDDAPFTVAGKIRVIGNGVPKPMGLAVANAVRHAMYPRRAEGAP